MEEKLAQHILAQVREEEIVAMSCDVINIPSPTGEEGPMGAYMRAAMDSLGLRVAWQEVEEGRANVVGLWEGAGGGANGSQGRSPGLMFNGHMDTSNSGQETFLTGLGYKPHAVVRDGKIYGLGIYNMKGALVCYVNAVRALQRAGVRLRGDVTIAAVVGEIEKSQWGDEFKGREYRGYGAGSHYLVNHGVLPDMCILGEPTDMRVIMGHYGSLWVRIATQGPYVHTGFSAEIAEQNSIRRMHEVMGAILEWMPEWEKRAAYRGLKGIANIGAIRGGYPWRASRTPATTEIFMDVRVPPTMALQQARGAVRDLVEKLRKRFPAHGIEWECYVSVPGAEIDEGHEVVAAIDASHRQVKGSTPERGAVLWGSDASVLTRFGIATVNYGPSSGPRDAEGEKVEISTLLDMTRIYALAAARICGVAL
jgi:acetylornithine deacetylase/succinyl-diaminopimelate desuccinylase-like protein